VTVRAMVLEDSVDLRMKVVFVVASGLVVGRHCAVDFDEKV